MLETGRSPIFKLFSIVAYMLDILIVERRRMVKLEASFHIWLREEIQFCNMWMILYYLWKIT
jgi:hypothetical protein